MPTISGGGKRGQGEVARGMVVVTQGTLWGGRISYRQMAVGHRSGFEPVLLAAAVPARVGERVLEAGAGAGAGLLCLAARVPGVGGVGIEIDEALVALANENFRNNGFEDVSCIMGNAVAPKFMEKFDHAMANPPWHDPAGTKSPDAGRALAHHATGGLLTAWVAGLVGCLKPRGTITLILPAASFAEAASVLRAQNCGALTLLPLWPKAGRPAKQMILAARRGAKGPDRLLAGLALHDAAGISAAANAILRGGMALPLR